MNYEPIPDHDRHFFRPLLEMDRLDSDVPSERLALAEAIGCPGCGETKWLMFVEVKRLGDDPLTVVHCDECGWEGPGRDDDMEAVDAWNKREEKNENLS